MRFRFRFCFFIEIKPKWLGNLLFLLCVMAQWGTHTYIKLLIIIYITYCHCGEHRVIMNKDDSMNGMKWWSIKTKNSIVKYKLHATHCTRSVSSSYFCMHEWLLSKSFATMRTQRMQSCSVCCFAFCDSLFYDGPCSAKRRRVKSQTKKQSWSTPDPELYSDPIRSPDYGVKCTTALLYVWIKLYCGSRLRSQ